MKSAHKNTPWQVLAAKVNAHFGHLVMKSHRPAKIGEIVSNLNVTMTKDQNTTQPFVVIGEATFDDWADQCSFIGRGTGPDEYHDFYYFVQTD